MNNIKAALGLDAAQAGVAFHLIDNNNNELAHGKLPASNDALARLGATLAAHHLKYAEVAVAIEATGCWHLPWSEKLHALGAKMYVLNPLVSKRTTALANAIRDMKTDPVDAAALAEAILREHNRLERFLYKPDAGLFKLHRLQSARQAVRESLTNLKRSLGGMLAVVFPELRSLKLTPKRELALLMAAPGPAQILALKPDELEKLAGKKAGVLREAAGQSFAVEALSQAAAPALQQLARVVCALEEQLAQSDTLISAEAPAILGAERLQRAQALPGFGDKTAVGILTNIPIRLLESAMPRRKLANKIQAHFGCEPRVRASGNWKGKIKISKRGCRYARTVLYQAAICAILNDDPLKDIYRSLKARGKHHKVAVFDIGRRLIRQLVAVLKTEPQPHQNTLCST